MKQGLIVDVPHHDTALTKGSNFQWMNFTSKE